MDPLTLFGLAVAPGLAICVFIYWKDKFEKEPRHNLFVSFIFGMLSIIPAIILESIAESAGLSGSSAVMAALSAFVGVALVEEGGKFFVLRFYSYRQPAFNEPYDGITYSVMVSMGFATIENIMYVEQNGAGNALLRMFTAVPAHATFGVIMGYYVGLAKFKQNSFVLLATGLLLATAMHGFYDFCLFQQTFPWLAGGAFISLLFGIRYSLRAIRLHEKISPFNLQALGQQKDVMDVNAIRK